MGSGSRILRLVLVPSPSVRRQNPPSIHDTSRLTQAGGANKVEIFLLRIFSCKNLKKLAAMFAFKSCLLSPSNCVDFHKKIFTFKPFPLSLHKAWLPLLQMGTPCPTSPLCHSSLRQIWPRKQVSLPQIFQNQNNSDLQFCMCLYNRVFRPHCATGYLELSDAVADANHLRRWTLFTKHYFTLFFFCGHCHVDPFPRYCKPPPSLKWISTSSKVEFDFTWKPRESWFNCPVSNGSH